MHDQLCPISVRCTSPSWTPRCQCDLILHVKLAERVRVRDAVAKAPMGTGGYATKQADLAAIDALA